MKKSFFFALLASMLILSACQGGGGDAIKKRLDPPPEEPVKPTPPTNPKPPTDPLPPSVSPLAEISDALKELKDKIEETTTSATVQAILNPDDEDRQDAREFVVIIDNVLNEWNTYKRRIDGNLLLAKMNSSEWREAEAVIKIISDLRPKFDNVANGGRYDTDDFEFLLTDAALEQRIEQEKAQIPVIDRGSSTVSSVEISNVSDDIVETLPDIIEDINLVRSGGTSINDLIRKHTFTRVIKEHKRSIHRTTITTQNVTTINYTDGSPPTIIVSTPRSVTNETSTGIVTEKSREDIEEVVPYTTRQEDTVVTVRQGRPEVVVENTDRVETTTNPDGSILNTTIRRSVTTTTTPVITETINPNITVYEYTDGHRFSHNDGDMDISRSIENIVDVVTNETIVQTTTEHIVASETTTNEVVTQVTESDPVFATTYEDRTTTSTSNNIETTTVTRYYTTTATVTTTTTTSTTPVTVQTWTDGRTDTIRGETVVTVTTSDTVQTDNWNVVVSTTTREVEVVNDDDPNMGTRTAGYNPDPVSYRTTEFAGTSGTNYKLAINADVAYSRGWTGKGSLITIADTGWDRDHPDLVGAVKHEFNTMTNDTTFMDDNVGHGSHVMGIAAGRKNGLGTHGVAFDADVAVAKISDSTGYSFQRALVAAAWARDLGSVAFNVSANYAEDLAFQYSITESGTRGLKYSNHYYYGVNGYNGSVVEAPLWATALGSNQILVNSAGNLRKDYVSGSAQMAHATDANGNLILGGRMIIVGSYDTVNQQVASYSNKAGTVCATWDFTNNVCKDAARASDFYILAPGDNIQSAYKDGTDRLMSGTSMAAPVVTGAIGIIHQMWPHMMGANLVQLLLLTADKDLPGYDVTVHGQGLLDLDKATQPVGATGIPTTGRTSGAIANIETLSGGAGVGTVSTDAFAALSNVAVLDSFERDFSVDLNNAQAVDTRPGSQVETLSFGGTYDGYWNLAGGSEKYIINDDLITSFKFDEENQLKGDWGLRLAYVLVDNSSTQFVASIGMVKETDKFLNNTQQGFMGVGKTHITNYAGVNVNHKFDDNWFAFGNLQLGLTDVEKSKEFSLVTGYTDLVSNSWGIGAGYQFDNGWTVGANFSQPMAISSGKMNYKVPVGRTLDGDVLFNEGSADASTKYIEYDTGLFVKYNLNDMSVAGYAEHRANVAGIKNNNEVNVGIKVDIKF